VRYSPAAEGAAPLPPPGRRSSPPEPPTLTPPGAGLAWALNGTLAQCGEVWR
jgi:hypothetical protein